ncbi:hypothetical protein KXV22_006199 [Aspergillus fumigatus]|nr:hypothetical protein KXV22_006199 [Aspergillus fumigatus]
MDIVLEIWDTFIGDRVYSALLPLSLSSTVSLPGLTNAANSSLSLFGASKPFVYEPATQLFRLEPSKYAYLSAWPRNNIYRQFLSFFLIVWIFGIIVYFISATLSYIFIWDKTTVKHPKFLKNQIPMEIAQTMRSMPVMSLLTAPFLVAEVRGYAKLYDSVDEEPFPYYSILQFPLFIAFTDFCIYWIHRGLHHPLIYKSLHKPHHKWIMPSPFASHAFHPLTYGRPIINGAACHTMHHLYFNYNYGQFTTLWDRLGGSYRKPNEELFRRETKMDEAEWKRQTKEMETILKTVEGEDDRKYLSQEEAKKDL